MNERSWLPTHRAESIYAAIVSVARLHSLSPPKNGQYCRWWRWRSAGSSYLVVVVVDVTQLLETLKFFPSPTKTGQDNWGEASKYLGIIIISCWMSSATVIRSCSGSTVQCLLMNSSRIDTRSNLVSPRLGKVLMDVDGRQGIKESHFWVIQIREFIRLWGNSLIVK